MKIQLDWCEEVTYRSTIEVDEDEIREWLADGGQRDSLPEDYVVTADDVRQFLEAGDEEEWFDQCDTISDFAAVVDRQIEWVKL